MNDYTILPFLFERTQSGDVIAVNECGDFVFLSEDDFDLFVRHKLSKDSKAFYQLKSHLFLAESEIDISLQKIATRLRTKKSFLRDFTMLHMLVITLRCNQKCEYCQVSCADEDAYKYDMNSETAKKVIDIILQSPTKCPKIEFQGGEPLLNWDVVKSTVIYAEELVKEKNKNVSFVLCTNLTLITEEHLDFCKEHKIYISTSIDGSKTLHDKCRKTKQGSGTYDTVLEKLKLSRRILGHDMVSALMTTSAYSLEHLKDVIDEYISLGIDGIFLRSLNPYGFAAEQADTLGYPMEKFVEKYLEALKYIIEINKKIYFPEFFATLLFSRILTPFSTGFVDLQSPSGAGISGAIYDFDGSVFPADEARMLARMGDRHFCLGNVSTDSFKEIFGGEKLRKLTAVACVETTPSCAYCGYQSFCGCDPIRNYLETGNELRTMSGSPFCIKHKGILEGLFEILRNADEMIENIIWSWITRNPKQVKRI